MDSYEARIQDAANRLLTSLRQGRSVDQRAAADLRSGLQDAAAGWAASVTVSKSAANLFVDLATGIGACGYLYRVEEGGQISLLADEVADLVRRCLEVRRSGIDS
jgi:hypothetical protein